MTDDRQPHVRRANGDDEDAVFGLAAHMALTFALSQPAFADSFRTLIALRDAFVLVVDVDGQVGGYLLGFTHPSFFANGPVAWVEEIAVHERLRRQHLGALLMGEFENQVRREGVRVVALATTRAGSFYEALGYTRRAEYFRKIV
jgi:GNAT superfamily N-acetyltransferase